MCEIAVVDPENCSQNGVHHIAAKFEREQGDGLGILCVERDEETGFDYTCYKSTDPHWQTVHQFLERNYADSWRTIIHGRASTSGDINRQSAHPIRVDCDHDVCSGEGEIKYVVHNGHVRNHSSIKGYLRRQDHNLNTDVDTEIIAHRVGTLPETVENHTRNTYRINGNLNYLAFSEDGILVRVSDKYHLTDDFRMTCSIADFGEELFGFEKGTDTEWMLITPDDIETKERPQRQSVYDYRSTSSTGTSPAARRETASHDPWSGRGRTAATTSQTDNTDEVEDGVVQLYEDHLKDVDRISALKVAPGVMKLINHAENVTDYVFREKEPRVYFYYSPDPTPENLDQLEELAQASTSGNAGNQKTLDEAAEQGEK